MLDICNLVAYSDIVSSLAIHFNTPNSKPSLKEIIQEAKPATTTRLHTRSEASTRLDQRLRDLVKIENYFKTNTNAESDYYRENRKLLAAL